MSVVDTFLGASGTTAACAREDLQAAFELLTSPYVARAVWLAEARDPIVLR